MMKKSALLVLSALALGGCSSSSSPSTTGGDGGGGGGGTTQYCPKISTADITALLKSAETVSETDATSTLLECDTASLQIQLNTEDADLTLYNSANGTAADTHAMQGFGDKAYWSAIGSGSGTAQSTPAVLVHKGNATCSLDANGDPSTLSMPYTTNPPPFAITTTDCDAWAQKAGKVCMDYFSAAGI